MVLCSKCLLLVITCIRLPKRIFPNSSYHNLKQLKSSKPNTILAMKISVLAVALVAAPIALAFGPVLTKTSRATTPNFIATNGDSMLRDAIQASGFTKGSKDDTSSISTATTGNLHDILEEKKTNIVLKAFEISTDVCKF